ncbi:MULTISPECIES: DMT family transporter [Streptomyces]|uniref:DMT family transporter n=1 Tax=Streptomyces TaxID=1883 RepID=UPI0014327D61|nr:MULTISPECIES: DMT family transporter [Streptomyces]GHE37196.1 membrane protein [Streptomyces griseoaurantiacus]MCF0086317.1 putative amino-acid metabolite efflux pump [Streptomyces sp. MH192]MCF0100065.1 putative amino-acid metabolite efflux pump [Streptomyces sp. MH191]MDX3091945.1 DMT family transporter [Streptomyces sp. ME12-02E]MDX3334965.1 DMT family transporter [Streptomyces sp. ME02-6978a]
MRERGGGVGAVSAVVAAALFWSSSYAVTKRALDDIGPLTIGALRFSLAALLLGLVIRMNRKRPARPDTRQRRQLYVSGFLGITVYFILENVGVDMSTASDASLIVATYPLMTMLLELVALRARMPWTRVTGVLLATVGAVLVVRSGAETGGDSRWVGDILLLLGGLAWAGYNVLGKRASAGQNAMSVTYYQTLAGAAGFLLASLLEAGDWRVPDATASALVVYLAVACSVGGFLLYNYGLRRMASSVAVNILNLVPVFGVAGAVIINDESIRLVQAAGGVVIILGVALGMLERGHRTPPGPEPLAAPSSPVASPEPAAAPAPPAHATAAPGDRRPADGAE